MAGYRSPHVSSDGSSAFGFSLPASNQQQQDQLLKTPVAPVMPAAGPRLRDSFLATLRESWARLELHAGGGGGAMAAAAAGAAAAAAAVPMRSLDLVTTPTRTSTSSSAAAAAAELAAVTARGQLAGSLGGSGGGGDVVVGGGGGSAADADGVEPLGSALSAEDLQVGDFNFSTHLVVDYSKPTRESPATPGRRWTGKRRGKDDTLIGSTGVEGGDDGTADHNDNNSNEEEEGEDEEGDDDDDGGSLSSVGSSGMGYDTSAEEQELERRRSSMTGSTAGLRPKPSGGSASDMAHGPAPSLPQGGGGAATAAADGGNGGGGRRPPLPPLRLLSGSRGASDGGGASTTAPSLSAQQAPAMQQSQASSGMPSRAAAWSGSVLSKLGLHWGRDRGGDSREGGATSITRNASAGSLLPFPTFRQSVMGSGQPAAAAHGSFSDRALEEQLAAGVNLGLTRGDDAGDGSSISGRYYRYVFDPADVQAEMEVTARVRRAAAEALMEANSKLAEAQAAAAALQQQVEQAKQLEQELEVLRAERSAAHAAKAALEDEMAAVRRQLEAIKETEASLQAELENVRSQADIWRSSKGGEPEKLKQENTLLRSQLTNRLSELQSCRSRLSDGETERQRLLREAEELRNKIQWLTKINLQLETAASQLNDARRAAAEWQERFMRERNVRRRLHDQLQQLRGNIRVVCRVRPVQVGQRDIVSYPLEGLLAVSPPDKRYQEFEFDHVFPPCAGQSVVFDEAVASLVRSVANGSSACVFAYGQTGSGKSYTMQGTSEDPAPGGGADNAIPAATPLETGADSTPAATTPATAASPITTAPASLGGYSIQVSMCEIYNEAVYDVLAPEVGEEDAMKALEVSTAGPCELPPSQDRIPGRTWRLLTSAEGVEALLRECARNRAAVAAALGIQSSRSHSVLSVRVEVAEGARTEGVSAVGWLHLVDLAGSERADKSDVAGQQSKEAQIAGRSLSALGDVISALQRRDPHVPFRNSALTAALQDSLCGDSEILLLCNIAPEATSASETVSSLNFASRAAQLELLARRAGSAERIDRMGHTSPVFTDRPQQEGSCNGVSRGSAAAASLTSSPLLPHPPLPIMNGTAAKLLAAGIRGGGLRWLLAYIRTTVTDGHGHQRINASPES
ncbi:kinesin [Volvox carteri f. nagariensis]|uniref:Kinesin n=1 Tax=Volvox carteri f. nagariensis TaxID=3068 RepID=D8U7B4_VOLCA|nr:kinesin [Volvox carteri f. nagariensis]EFJ44391.1 kinesin [Volvox carteri f. nagariensis]|eukprot:XP_002954498.1 kinesin [Volvox carteri f. nagariensis]